PHSFLHWINDGLMSIFFFLAGLEIKRELLEGELKEPKKALLPIFAAIGGMLVPAVVYTLVNKGGEFANGWGIPMATDIAFSLGITSLLGKRVPLSLKVFLIALAIIDDLGAILIIAVFYGGQINWLMLGASVALILLIAILARKKVSLSLRLILGICLWYLIFNSGIHATVAGVALAFTVPLRELGDLEHRLHIPVNFLILPIFALANTAVSFNTGIMETLTHPINFGIMAGLVIGKPLGIVAFCYMLTQMKWGKLPAGTSWTQISGIGMLAGIGFTMSIFITTLAFTSTDTQDLAKVSILLASLLSLILGCSTLYFTNSRSSF
ncbi:MAG: Na+/H+ antiporter NhaA, partial [Sphingobacteriales bacterium]